MAVSQEVPKNATSLVSRLLTTDFCPWANRFVYWLKEPVGWFVLATLISVLIGMYFAPIGWTLAAALVGMISVGMVWPWVAVRAVTCSLYPEVDQVHEDDDCFLKLSIRNRLPLPVWGLAVEGFLDRTVEESDSESASETIPTVALAFVRGLSISTYRFSINPSLRGRYPDEVPTLTCSFPFGIWTARRRFSDIKPITVWPKVFPISGETAMAGRRRAEHGEGNRPGRTGDFIGVREYRQGDSAKQVNWVATARSGSLIVTQRSGPECPIVDVLVDVAAGQSRAQIADRIRVAASILASLHVASIPLRLRIGSRSIAPRLGRDGFAQLMDALADVPLDGDSEVRLPNANPAATSITITSDKLGNPLVSTNNPMVNHRASTECDNRVIDRRAGLASQLLEFWTEVRDANMVA